MSGLLLVEVYFDACPEVVTEMCECCKQHKEA